MEVDSETRRRVAGNELSAPNHPGRDPTLKRNRLMTRSQLMGAHSHRAENGTWVHVYQRDGKFLVRGRFENHQFGKELGHDPAAAAAGLRRLLAELENGTFIRPSESRRRPLAIRPIPQFTLRQLCNEFLVEKRQLRGERTAKTYESRLQPVLDFAEQQSSLKRWRLAMGMDRTFGIELRAYLMNRQVTRNGSTSARIRPMSVRQVRNCLETIRAVLAWGLRADVRHLPPEFVNPITPELLGSAPTKDPIRKQSLPIGTRIQMIERTNEWQMLHLSILTIIPLRFEDVAGALISDVDIGERTLRLGTRFGGSDFTKGRQEVLMPLPTELIPILQRCIAGRREGPLFRSREAWHGRIKPRKITDSRSDLEALFHRELGAASSGSVTTEQDRKRIFRQLLRSLGGISEDLIGKELRGLMAGITDVRPYDIRGAVSNDLKNADLGHLELRYHTGHAANDIMNEYVSLDPEGAMRKYFRHIDALLQAIAGRARYFGIDG